jgi:FKBP-type peptidyl-prolyl cis-trans isomerase (trigger factor)
VPGFRPGKAPLNIVNSKVSKEEILERSANTQIRKSLRELQDTPEFTKISDEIIS